MRSDAIVYGTDRPAQLHGRTLHITSGPSYDSVRVYGLWLPGHPLLVTITGLATGRLSIVWESPWREHTTSTWRETVIESAIRVRHDHRHGAEPGQPYGSRSVVGDPRSAGADAPQAGHHTNPHLNPSLNLSARNRSEVAA